MHDLADPVGDDVELRWDVQHPLLSWSYRLHASPAVGEFSYAETIEMHVERRERLTRIRLRVAIDDHFPVDATVGTTMGLNLEVWREGSGTRWEVAPRHLNLHETRGDRRRSRLRDPTFDGRLEIALWVAPAAPTRNGRWLLRAGRTYELVYRVYNRTAADARVRIDGRTLGAPRVDEVRRIAAGGFIEVDMTTTPAEGDCMGPEHCHHLGVAFEAGGPWIDALNRSVEVLPVAVAGSAELER